MRTIAARLLMAFLCVILFLVLQGVSTHVVTTRLSGVQRDALSRELHIEALQERLARTRLIVFKVLGTMDPHEMDELRARFEEAVRPLSEDLAAQGVDPEMVRRNADLYHRIIALHYDFSVRTARTLINAESKEIHEELVRRLETRGRELARATATRVAEAHRKAHWTSAGLLACALAVAGIWAYVLVHTLTDRRRAEEQIRESEERYRILFDLSPQAIALTEFHSGRLLDVNARFLEITGYEKGDVIGRSTADLFYSPEDRQRFLDEMEASGAVRGLETVYRARDGTTIQALVFSRRIQLDQGPVLLTIFLDMTRQKRLEAQLQQAQRLESIGTLAGGIAHDFNNLLMGIQGRTSLMLADLDGAHPHREQLESIEELVRSASDLTRQLLGFARGGKYEVKPTDLNELVSRSAEMFGRTRKDIRITLALPDDTPTVEADRRQIEQVLFNLFVNASHAMPGGGEIRIATGSVFLDEKEAPLRQANPGRYAFIRVADTGTGMDRATLQRIFDPFFTTKEVGRGTGLGLASAYGIVKNHGGFIEVTSTPGRGTTFQIHLPATATPVTESREPDRGLSLGSGTILIVDDERMVADVGAKMIEKLGYEALVARSGEEALDLYRKEGQRIDLVVLDMVMPGMGGGETFDRLRAMHPDVRVILSSGYSMEGRAMEILDRGCKGFIQKPFDLHELSARLEEVLGATRPD
jgi:two-component system, cell cycle sensor histidine kinase and response regulator CckA